MNNIKMNSTLKAFSCALGAKLDNVEITEKGGLMNFGRWLISLSLLLFSMSASAEYYRYLDKDGNVHYTDDLTQVPENQRTDIHEYNEIQSDMLDRQKNEEKTRTPEPLFEEKQMEDKHDTNNFSETKKRLDRKKEELNREYKALMEEKKQLTENEKKLKSGKATRKYNKAVLKFNQKIEDYEGRNKEFNAEVEKYNIQVEKSMLNKLEKRKKKKEED